MRRMKTTAQTFPTGNSVGSLVEGEADGVVGGPWSKQGV